jgi:hypothetical protein
MIGWQERNLKISSITGRSGIRKLLSSSILVMMLLVNVSLHSCKSSMNTGYSYGRMSSSCKLLRLFHAINI